MKGITMSPTVFKYGPYRFYFWSNEAGRPHIHCESGEKNAKYWLEKADNPLVEIELGETSSYAKHELTQIKEIIDQHHYEFLKKWYDFFRKPYPEYLQ